MSLYGLVLAWAFALAQGKTTSKTIHPQEKDSRPSDCTFKNDEYRRNFQMGHHILLRFMEWINAEPVLIDRSMTSPSVSENQQDSDTQQDRANLICRIGI